MEIFCDKCQKKVGQITDEKIPVGKKMSVTCPECKQKIYFIKPVDFSSEYHAADEEAAAPGAISTEEAADNSVPEAPSGNAAAYDFAIMAIIREAWQKTAGMKGPVWGAISLVFLAILVFVAGTTFISKIIGPGSVAVALGVAAQLTVSVATYPFMAGLVLLGIRQAVGRPVNYKLAFSCFGYILPLVVSSFLVSLLSCLGFILLLIPGIYLTFAYLLVVPLIIDKGMGPWQAMEASRKAVHHRWFKVFGLYLLMIIICLLSAIPMGLGLIWTVPMFIMVGSILYREIFGVSENS